MDEQTDVIQALNRLVQIGWVSSFGYRANGELYVEYTPVGKRHLKALWTIFGEITLGVDPPQGSGPLLWQGIILAALYEFGPFAAPRRRNGPK